MNLTKKLSKKSKGLIIEYVTIITYSLKLFGHILFLKAALGLLIQSHLIFKINIQKLFEMKIKLFHFLTEY